MKVFSKRVSSETRRSWLALILLPLIISSIGIPASRPSPEINYTAVGPDWAVIGSAYLDSSGMMKFVSGYYSQNGGMRTETLFFDLLWDFENEPTAHRDHSSFRENDIVSSQLSYAYFLPDYDELVYREGWVQFIYHLFTRNIQTACLENPQAPICSIPWSEDYFGRYLVAYFTPLAQPDSATEQSLNHEDDDNGGAAAGGDPVSELRMFARGPGGKILWIVGVVDAGVTYAERCDGLFDMEAAFNTAVVFGTMGVYYTEEESLEFRCVFADPTALDICSKRIVSYKHRVLGVDKICREVYDENNNCGPTEQCDRLRDTECLYPPVPNEALGLCSPIDYVVEAPIGEYHVPGHCDLPCKQENPDSVSCHSTGGSDCCNGRCMRNTSYPFACFCEECPVEQRCGNDCCGDHQFCHEDQGIEYCKNKVCVDPTLVLAEHITNEEDCHAAGGQWSNQGDIFNIGDYSCYIPMCDLQ